MKRPGRLAASQNRVTECVRRAPGLACSQVAAKEGREGEKGKRGRSEEGEKDASEEETTEKGDGKHALAIEWPERCGWNKYWQREVGGRPGRGGTAARGAHARVVAVRVARANFHAPIRPYV